MENSQYVSEANKERSKISTLSDESCCLNSVKENGASCRSPSEAEVASDNDYVVTKEGELLPKVKAKLMEVIKSRGMTKFTVDVSAGSGVGDNFLGFIGKVAIKGLDKSGKPSTWNWIVKTAPTQELYRKIFKIDVLYAREVYVYERIFPIFEEFQREKSVLAPFNQYPPFLFSYLESYNEAFAMEDMKSKGYVMKNRQKALDYNHVKMVMQVYAKMHAVSYALKDQKPDLYEELKANTGDSMTNAYSREAATETMNNDIRKALEALDEDNDADTLAKFKQISVKFIDIYYDLVESPTEYAVIGHGDSWVNNMLWMYDDRNIPKEVCLLDFQLSRYGSPACDLSYFIFTCTEKALRDEHYDDMIKLYYYHLSEQLVEMGSDPQKCLPFSVLQEELKRFSLIGLYYTIMVLAIITRDADEIPNLREGNKKIEELDKEWNNKSKHHKEYCRRIRGCLIDFVEKGYFDYYIEKK